MDMTLFALLPLSSSPLILPASDGLAIAASMLLRVPIANPALFPISIGGRLLAEAGEPRAANASAEAFA